jgi:hypothetical protein
MADTKQLIKSGRGSTDVSSLGTLRFKARIALDTLDTDGDSTKWYRYLKIECKQIDGWWSVEIQAKKLKLKYEAGGWFSAESISVPGRGTVNFKTVTEVETDPGEYDELTPAITDTYQLLVDHLTERMQTEKEIAEMEEEAREELEDALGELDLSKIPDYREL